MSARHWTLAAGLGLALALPAGQAAAAPWNPTGAVARGDFDADGRLETVVSSPEDAGNKGAVWVVDHGAGTATKWTRGMTGLVGGAAAAGDFFGAALTVGDFDGDGYDDLAIGAPGADFAGPTDSGVVHVIYGSSTGLTTTGDQVFHQDSTGIQGVAEADDQFGDVLTVGDFDCDGYDDLVVGVPSEGIGSHAEAGAVHVLYGGSTGIRTTNDLYYQGSGGVNGIAEAGDHFGGAVVAGNFNGDTASSLPCEDLAIAAPDEDIGSIANAGYVYVIYSAGTSGLSTTGDFSVHQDVTGVEDACEEDDRFGLRLFSKDEDGDGYDDLFVITPGDSCIAGHGEGAHRFHGTSSGLSITGNELQCHDYGCEIDPDEDFYACHTRASTIYGSEGADGILLFLGSHVVLAGGGDDSLGGGQGDDVVFGGAGNDTFLWRSRAGRLHRWCGQRYVRHRPGLPGDRRRDHRRGSGLGHGEEPLEPDAARESGTHDGVH